VTQVTKPLQVLWAWQRNWTLQRIGCDHYGRRRSTSGIKLEMKQRVLGIRRRALYEGATALNSDDQPIGLKDCKHPPNCANRAPKLNG